jgi:hypothetical protein
MRLELLFLSLALVLFLSGCATIIHVPDQKIYFSSEPSGSKISINGKECGITPRTIWLNRFVNIRDGKKYKKIYKVKFEFEGYEPFEKKIISTIDDWFWGNLLFGGIVGMTIDAITGSMYRLTPNAIYAKLVKSTTLNRINKEEVYYSENLDSYIY